MFFAPLHDHGQLFPVIDLLEFHHFHRCAGNDHTVEPFLAYFLKSNIKLIDVAGRRIFGYMGRQHQKGAVDLQRRVGQSSQQLGLCLFL